MNFLPNELLLKIAENLDRKDIYRKFIQINKQFLSLVNLNKSRLEWPLFEFCYVGQVRFSIVFFKIIYK